MCPDHMENGFCSAYYVQDSGHGCSRGRCIIALFSKLRASWPLFDMENTVGWRVLHQEGCQCLHLCTIVFSLFIESNIRRLLMILNNLNGLALFKCLVQKLLALGT